MQVENLPLNEQYSEADIEAAAKVLEENSRVESEKQAQAILKKYKREIKRLNLHAQGAVLENNFDAYKYAIEKLRTIYRQPYNDELIVNMWATTRHQIWSLINAGTKEV